MRDTYANQEILPIEYYKIEKTVTSYCCCAKPGEADLMKKASDFQLTVQNQFPSNTNLVVFSYVPKLIENGTFSKTFDLGEI